MLHFFRLLVFLIKIDQETVLNWFVVSNLDAETIDIKIIEDNFSLLNDSVESSTSGSFETLKLLLAALFVKIGNGLRIEDIEVISFFILFIRFLILIIKYNLKTSFYITCIGMLAGFLWYRHLCDIIGMYRNVYIDIALLADPKINQGLSFSDLVEGKNSSDLPYFLTDPDKRNIPWYNVGQLMCYAVLKGVINTDKETGNVTYIDPLSMIISSLKNSDKARVLDIYYTVYNNVLPKFFKTCGKFWSQLSGVASYAIITRIGKKYCPYLIRWHWTFLLVFAIGEQFLVYLVYRINYFITYVLPESAPEPAGEEDLVSNLEFDLSDVQSIIEIENVANNEIDITKVDLSFLGPYFALKNFLADFVPSQHTIATGLLSIVILSHLSFIIFGLLYAISGQYFLVPFFVSNTELHVGQRPKNSIYSGGKTPWQDGQPNSRLIFAWERLLKRLITSSLQLPTVLFILIRRFIFRV